RELRSPRQQPLDAVVEVKLRTTECVQVALGEPALAQEVAVRLVGVEGNADAAVAKADRVEPLSRGERETLDQLGCAVKLLPSLGLRVHAPSGRLEPDRLRRGRR